MFDPPKKNSCVYLYPYPFPSLVALLGNYSLLWHLVTIASSLPLLGQWIKLSRDLIRFRSRIYTFLRRHHIRPIQESEHWTNEIKLSLDRKIKKIYVMASALKYQSFAFMIRPICCKGVDFGIKFGHYVPQNPCFSGSIVRKVWMLCALCTRAAYYRPVSDAYSSYSSPPLCLTPV